MEKKSKTNDTVNITNPNRKDAMLDMAVPTPVRQKNDERSNSGEGFFETPETASQSQGKKGLLGWVKARFGPGKPTRYFPVKTIEPSSVTMAALGWDKLPTRYLPVTTIPPESSLQKNSDNTLNLDRKDAVLNMAMPTQPKRGFDDLLQNAKARAGAARAAASPDLSKGARSSYDISR